MTTPADKTAPNVDESVERILGNARPRPVPSADETEDVRQFVHAEWQKVAGRRHSRRQFSRFAIAASVLLAVFVSFNTLRQFGTATPQVASIDKSVGSIYVLGENAEMLAGNQLRTVVAGQTLITDDDSGVGLNWEGGGSLRIGADSRVEFVSTDSVYLHSGRIYFDSKPQLLATAQSNSSAANLTIRTDFGTVSHVGTQYMTEVEQKSLTVSIRDGEVVLITDRDQESANVGQQLKVGGNGPVEVTRFRSYGENWAWTEPLSPDADIDGRSIHVFLEWVAHETGMRIEYEKDDLKDYAEEEELTGIVKMEPTAALNFYMKGIDLGHELQDDVIKIIDVGAQSEE